MKPIIFFATFLLFMTFLCRNSLAFVPTWLYIEEGETHYLGEEVFFDSNGNNLGYPAEICHYYRDLKKTESNKVWVVCWPKPPRMSEEYL